MSWNDGDSWTSAGSFTTKSSLEYCPEGNVFISGATGAYYIKAWCSEWTEDNWGVAFKAIIKKDCRDLIAANIVPGATRMMYNILGTPVYKDITYTSSNSMKVIPDGNVENLDTERLITITDYKDTIINGSSGYFLLTIKGNRLDIS